MEAEAKELIIPLLQNSHHTTVVELGAQDGDDTEWLSKAAGDSSIYIALEPDPRNVKLFRKKFGSSRIRFRETAVSNNNGVRPMFLCSNITGQELASSSLKTPTGHLEYFPWCRFDQSVLVRCTTLDELFESEDLTHIDLLWVDIQGSEKDMISQGQQALQRTRYLFIECEEKELYEGQALREELLALLPDWELVKEYAWNLLLRNKHFGERSCS